MATASKFLGGASLFAAGLLGGWLAGRRSDPDSQSIKYAGVEAESAGPVPVYEVGEGNMIGTHSGSFHCDEALACYMLRLLPQYKDWPIVRTRDPHILERLPIIVDVGGKYDPATCRFDHHQRGFTETFSEEHNIKLSSAGLVYKHFGRAIVKLLTGGTDEEVDTVYLKVYSNFVEALDGIDNGVNQYPKDIKHAYSSRTDLSSRVGQLNPSWNEKGVDLQARFFEAMQMVGKEFEGCVLRTFNSWLPARELVKDAVRRRHEHGQHGHIMVLHQYTSWGAHIHSVEAELKLEAEQQILYVLYADSSGKWRVQAVPERSGSFVSRLPLPESWRGVRDDELSQLTGIPGCIFVHASGFIGGNATFEGVLEMATASLRMANKLA